MGYVLQYATLLAQTNAKAGGQNAQAKEAETHHVGTHNVGTHSVGAPQVSIYHTYHYCKAVSNYLRHVMQAQQSLQACRTQLRSPELQRSTTAKVNVHAAYQVLPKSAS